MNSEFEELLLDVTEYAEYCGEIGFDQVAVDLPPLPEAASAERLPRIAQKPATTPIERFVPDELPIAMEQKPPQDQPARTSRLGLIEQSRLSNITSPEGSGRMRERPQSTSPKPEAISTVSQMIDNPSLTLPDSKENIGAVREDIGDCRRCGLCEERTQVVHSTGNLEAQLMFVGEAPGADEDQKGEPFVGRAGQLLTKIIEAIGFSREDVFIGNINRCRPPGNRQPTLPEADACKPFLLREIAIVRPKVIVVLGNTACQNLLNTKIGITKLRGNFQDYYGVKVMPTFHPAYLLRDPNKKREVWDDMKKVRDYLNTL